MPAGSRTGIVLAGGEARRFGTQKTLATFRGRPLFAWASDALRPHCDELFVMAGPRDAPALSRVADGARVLADPGGGPHVALAYAARLARGETLLVAPGDAPMLTPAVYAALLAAGPNAVAVDGDGINPLIAVYDRRALLAAMPARSLQDVAARVDAARVPVAGDLRDVDTPQDLSALGG